MSGITEFKTSIQHKTRQAIDTTKKLLLKTSIAGALGLALITAQNQTNIFSDASHSLANIFKTALDKTATAINSSSLGSGLIMIIYGSGKKLH